MTHSYKLKMENKGRLKKWNGKEEQVGKKEIQANRVFTRERCGVVSAATSCDCLSISM